MKEEITAAKQFDEAMVHELAWVLFGLECAGGSPEEVDNGRLRRHAEKILAELSKEYAIVPKDEYELLGARLEHFRGALTREERIAHTLAESLAQTLRDNQVLREKEASSHA